MTEIKWKKSVQKTILMKTKNIVIGLYLELNAFNNMSISDACRFGLG